MALKRPSLALLPGLVAGGFCARLALELTVRPWPPLLILATATLGAVGGATLARRFRRALWPLLLLGLYLVWPWRNLSLALQLLALGVLALLSRLRSPARLTDRLLNLLTFGVAFAVYVATTAPGVLPADSGEFQIVAALLGVAHPPGYPLYTLVGWLFIHLIPLGAPAYRLNLLSALLAAGTLTLLSAAARHWVQRLNLPEGAARMGGLVTALALGGATTFWAQAGIANIRMPTVFLAALALYALARYAADDRRLDRWLGLLALSLGLGMGHHPSLAFLALFMLVYLLLVDPRLPLQPRRWWRPLLVLVLSLTPLLYLPWRGAANAVLAPPNLDTWDGFWFHVTAQGFEGDMFAFANAQDLLPRLALLPTLLRFQFNPLLVVGAALGAIWLLRRDRRLFLLLVGGWALHTFVSITYRAPQTVEYMLPAYLPIALLAGLLAAALFHRTPYVLRFTPHLFLLAALVNGLAHAPSFFALARDNLTREAMGELLQQAPPGALILADWRWATPLWYLQWVEGQRPDVEVAYVYPVGAQHYDDTWRDRIRAVGGARPLLLTRAIEMADYVLEPVGRGFAIHARPHAAGDVSALAPLDETFEYGGNGVRLVGYRLDAGQAQAGQQVELTLAWQPVGPLTLPPSFSVKLLAADGRQRAQADRYLGSDYAPGETRYERLVLPLYPDLPPGPYGLTVEVYHLGETRFETWPTQKGAERAALATLTVVPRREAPLTLHPLNVPFDGGPTLVGVDYDRSAPDTLRLYLHWRGPAEAGEQARVADGEVALPLLPAGAYHTAILDLPGATRGRLSLALTGADGRARTAAGPWGWPLTRVRLPAPSSEARFVPFADEMALVGVTPAGGGAAPAGGTLSLRLDFVALKALTDDDGVSVRLWDGSGALRVIHDLQPALGAIPTLKWIRGSRVSDPHPLEVPAELGGDVVHATLVVYENFRKTTLTPLDGRFDEVPLGTWNVQGP